VTRNAPAPALSNYGAIIVGGGHNGLICAAYLAKAGISTLVLEARATVGGNAGTDVDLGGARVNICNCEHTMVRATPIAEELRLADYGLRYLEPEITQVNIHWDGGPPWFQFHSLDRTLDALGATYPGDVDNYRNYVKAAIPLAKTILDIANEVPAPGSVIGKVAGVAQAKAIKTMLDWRRHSIADMARKLFNAEQLRTPMITTGPSVWGLSPETPGTGLGAIGYAMRHAVPIGRPVGGSGAMPDAVRASFEAMGGQVRTGARVERILCERDGVRGVQLVGGEQILAPIVVAATDPALALLEWITDPPPSLAPLVAQYRSHPVHDGYEAKVDAVLNRRYRYRAATDALLQRLGIDSHDTVINSTTIMSLSINDIARSHAEFRQGIISERPQLFSNLPSVLDPSMAAGIPGGGDVFSLEVLWTPYGLAGGWDNTDEPMKWLRAYDRHVEMDGGGSFVDAVKDWRLMGPVEYEKEFSMRRGHAPAFAGSPISALLGKDPDLTRYETPLAGLFLTGAATFPGAGVWGASGRNAASAILRSDARSARARRAAQAVAR
jgi:phytoene dehydrogenase-like protein